MASSKRKQIILPSSPNKERRSPPSKRAKPSDEASDDFLAMIEEPEPEKLLFEIPNCPICLEPLNLPIVDSLCCLNQFCEECALQWIIKGGSNTSEPQCPLCKAIPFKVQQSRVFNRFLGSREVPCPNASNGCNIRVSINDLQGHMDTFCEFTPSKCSQEMFGCMWAGPRSESDEHERNCLHRESAKMKDAWAKEELRMTERLCALQDSCSMVEGRIDQAIVKFEGFVKKKIKEFEHVQQLHLNPVTKRYMLKTDNGQHALQVRRHDAKYKVVSNILLRLVVTVSSDNYVLSVTAGDPKLRYPFMFVGYIACLNQGMPKLQAANHFAIRFGDSKQTAEVIAIPKVALELGTTDTGGKQVEPIIVQIVASAF